jgi:hypothetical protein
MIVPVTSPSGELVEWGLVELQGKVEHREGLEGEEALHIGTLALSPAVSGARRGRTGRARGTALTAARRRRPRRARTPRR